MELKILLVVIVDLFERYLEVVSLVGENTWFRKSGFVACRNEVDTGGILVTGLNPSVPVNGLYVPTRSYPNPFSEETNSYFTKIKSILPEEYIDRTAYLDLFPFYEHSQESLLWQIEQNPNFAAKILAVTKEEIERLCPRLIIIASKASYPFWGVYDDSTWMGYKFEEHEIQGVNNDVRRISGFKERKDIVGISKNSKLVGSIVVLYNHPRALKKEEILSPEQVKSLYESAIQS